MVALDPVKKRQGHTEEDMAPQRRQAVGFLPVEIDDEREPCGSDRIGGEDADTPRLDEAADPRGCRRDQLAAFGRQCRPVIADEIASVGHELQGKR